MGIQIGLEPISRDECRALLDRTEVGRVAFSDRALPAIVPVTFGVAESAVVIRTGKESRLARTGDGAVVSFEIDEIEPALRLGWSVVITGQASRISDCDEIDHWASRIRPWAPGPRDYFLRIPMTIVSGRRIEALPGDSSATAAHR